MYMNYSFYDIVFLSNTPSFYKVNLCNEIGKSKKLLLVLLGYGAEAVNDTLKGNSSLNFDYVFLHVGDLYKRNKLKVFLKLINLFRHLEYGKVLYSGWMIAEFNLLSFILPRSKNAVICESTIWESHMRGVKGWLKRGIISRMGTALPSGIPHKELFDSICYKGKINITGGVGLINYGIRRLSKPCPSEFRYLYVGRLTSVKNLKFLIHTFNQNGKLLTIVGNGELEQELKALSKTNISFVGFIDNVKLREVYESHDVLILPSSYEAWGLVVEEALYWGLPVLVSDKVGCGIDLVENYNSGLIFSHSDSADLQLKIVQIEKDYSVYVNNVNKIDWEYRKESQIEAYNIV